VSNIAERIRPKRHVDYVSFRHSQGDKKMID
jgi:hypothetical protein